MSQEKVILTPSFHVFAYEMQEALLEGFTINDSNPPTWWGTCYEAHMIKKEDITNRITGSEVSAAYALAMMPELPVKRQVGRPKQNK